MFATGRPRPALEREHTAGRLPGTPLRLVDFGGEIVVPFFQGERPTGGYAVEISGITATAARLVVRVEVASPPPGLPVIQVLTQPYHIVKLPRPDLPRSSSWRRLDYPNPGAEFFSVAVVH